MLTGDRQESGDAVAKLTGVQEVHARLLPQDKTRIITEMQQAGRHVAMVGDGVNDAAALADAMDRLASDPARAAEMGRAGRERVLGSFSAQAYWSGIEHWYRELAG